MHFLMPHVFESHRDFKEWFSNPMSGMVEGNNEYNDSLIRRLHKVLRPFILRRLKSEVEKQLPKKYEHLVKCHLSKRQRYLYDDFMSRAKTRETLASGNLLSVINVLMQLRKCCNHPNLFEPRPTVSPLVMTGVGTGPPAAAVSLLGHQPLEQISLASTPLLITPLEAAVTGYTWYRCSSLRCPPAVMLSPPGTAAARACPAARIRLEVRAQQPALLRPNSLTEPSRGAFCQLEQSVIGPLLPARHLARPAWLYQPGLKLKSSVGYYELVKRARVIEPVRQEEAATDPPPPAWSGPIIDGKTQQTQDLVGKRKTTDDPHQDLYRHARGIFSASVFTGDCLASATRSPVKSPSKRRKLGSAALESALELPRLKLARAEERLARRKRNLELNNLRTGLAPVFGSDLVEVVQRLCLKSEAERWELLARFPPGRPAQSPARIISCYHDSARPATLLTSLNTTVQRLGPIFSQFVMYIPAALVTKQAGPAPAALAARTSRYPADFLAARFQILTPDTRLIQYDCGKLQVLARLLAQLQSGGHRALIFTQMTKMLDVLEAFLNYHGYVYMRLDGSTKVETRQCLMERFNNDKKYFIFILSTRSGGVGINLTGADTVIFYDSDWNPTMDAQAQDRCHRIGQTRDVHIYRLVSERTVEENILKKANQKRLLGDIAIEGGNFTTAFFKKSTITDLFSDATNKSEEPEEGSNEVGNESQKKQMGAFENALASAEDATDIQATKEAKAEENLDDNDFKDEDEQFNAVLNELKSVERYALKFMEYEEAGTVQEKMNVAQAEIEARKEEFDAGKLDELTQEMREELGLSSGGEEDDEEEEHEAMVENGEISDYAPDVEDSDDEVTIEKEEKTEAKDEFEISMLENDAEVPVEELLKMYYPDVLKQIQVDPVVSEVREEGRKKTRSRGNVEINLWDLENPEDQLFKKKL